MDDGGDQRIHVPDKLGDLKDDEFHADQDLCGVPIRKELLAKIRQCYEKVKLVEIGFCFGLLDPVSNIVVGEAIALHIKANKQCPAVEEEEEEEADLAEETRRELPIGRCIYQRSLDGLVAFLVALFPYLTNRRAMWYLNKADLDPLVAARLVVHHRWMERTFGFQSDATVAAVGMALRCAAAAAEHPNPRLFSLGWNILSPSLREVANKLSRPYAARHPSQLIDIMPLLGQSPTPPPPLTLEGSWELASGRHKNLKHTEMQVPLRPTLRRMLFTTIHGYYLRALALLPKDKLRSHEYHHSLLHAGHCYGPWDPVSNIIVNTLWYAHAYPLTLGKKVEIKAISTKALLRIALRSLYGLISFRCTRFPGLTHSEAMQRLQLAGANLQEADNDLTSHGNGFEEAYVAAAKAAHHPKPLQQAQFLAGPSDPVMLSALSQLLKHEEEASQILFDYFRGNQQSEETKNIQVLGPRAYSRAMGMINDFWKQHAKTVAMVKSAIDMYNLQHGVPKYELHVICGFNEYVGGPVDANPFQHTCRCSHVNFLAAQNTGGTPPKLFFAECRNDGSKEVVLCCPVPMPLPGTEQVRCFYCECRGDNRIVHPAKESFRGRDREFEKMLGGQRIHSIRHTNDDIISHSHYETLSVDNILEEDCIYGDYSCDNQVEELPWIDDIC